MALIADYHTHTKYSRKGHAKGTVEENVRIAYEKGLRQIAITDHGFNQTIYGVRRKDIENVKKDIEEAKEMYKGGLESIEGVGPATRRALLRQFKTIENIKNATLEELEQTKGVTKPTASIIFKHFRKN